MYETLGIGAAFVGATVALVLAIYFGARRVLSDDVEEKTSDLAGSVLFRISGLHGLVLALVFASDVVEYQQLNFESTTETNAVADIFFDIERYGAPEAQDVQTALRTYVELAARQEWQHLGKTGTLLSSAWIEWDRVYETILDLKPATPRETALRDNMLKDIHVIAGTRDLREHHALTGTSSFFWFAAIAGVVLVAGCYYFYPPNRNNLILLSLFAAYTGIILFIIYAMSNPFSPPGALRPDILEAQLSKLVVTPTLQTD